MALGVLAASAIGLGFLLFHGLPGLLDELLVDSRVGARSALGPTPYLGAFVAFVNLHHYFMDSVIWRREVPEARALFERQVPAEPTLEGAPEGGLVDWPGALEAR